MRRPGDNKTKRVCEKFVRGKRLVFERYRPGSDAEGVSPARERSHGAGGEVHGCKVEIASGSRVLGTPGTGYLS